MNTVESTCANHCGKTPVTPPCIPANTGGAACTPPPWDCNRTTPYTTADGPVSYLVGDTLFYAIALRETTTNPYTGSMGKNPSWYSKPCDEWLMYYVDINGEPLENGDCVITCDDINPNNLEYVTINVAGEMRKVLSVKMPECIITCKTLDTVFSYKDGKLTLNTGNGLTITNGTLVAMLSSPLIFNSAGAIGLNIGDGLIVNDGKLVANVDNKTVKLINGKLTAIFDYTESPEIARALGYGSLPDNSATPASYWAAKQQKQHDGPKISPLDERLTQAGRKIPLNISNGNSPPGVAGEIELTAQGTLRPKVSGVYNIFTVFEAKASGPASGPVGVRFYRVYKGKSIDAYTINDRIRINQETILPSSLYAADMLKSMTSSKSYYFDAGDQLLAEIWFWDDSNNVRIHRVLVTMVLEVPGNNNYDNTTNVVDAEQIGGPPLV